MHKEEKKVWNNLLICKKLFSLSRQYLHDLNCPVYKPSVCVRPAYKPSVCVRPVYKPSVCVRPPALHNNIVL